MENINDLMPLSKDWNKERLAQLKNLFPDLFTNEGKLNIDELKKVVDPASVSETERYEFRWFGKSAAKRNAYTPSNATLMYDEHRSVNPNESENLIIEGENLEVLKLLSDSYREQIKCIYIDPPYNTGKDFVYSDNYTEDKKPYWEQTGVTENGVKIDTNIDSDGRYHSNWLNMMYSRLLLSRTMLKPEGVIFISLDENEIHHLRKLCDEVFGEQNFISCITVVSNPRGRDYGGVAKMHEYIMVYIKSEDSEINDLNEPDKVFPFTDSISGYELRELRNRNIAFNSENRPNLYYPFYINPNNQDENGLYEIGLEQKEGWIELYPKESQGFKTVWRWGKPKALENININIAGKEMEDEGFQIVEKYRKKTKMARSVWWDKEDNTEKGTLLVKSLFDGKKVMDFPKPVEMIQKIIEMGTSPDSNDIILDFFGGSGTTAQAVMQQNQIDNGNRKFILVQLPEIPEEKSAAYKAGYRKISDITIERNKRAIAKIIEEKKKQQPDLFTNGHKDDAINGLGFKVFKLVKSNFPRVEWAPDVEKTDEENIASLKKYIADKEAQLVTAFNRNELLTEILLKNGFQLNYKADKQEQFKKNEILLATDGIKETLICLDVTIEADTVEYFKKHTDKKFICLERALDTTKKYNLKHYLGDMFNAF
jgi:adenine-specific DNA-methyltransferase